MIVIIVIPSASASAPVAPVAPLAPVNPVAPVSPCEPVGPTGPTICPTLVQAAPSQIYKSPSAVTIYASLVAPVAGRDPVSATVPITLIDVPCGPVGPVEPVLPVGPSFALAASTQNPS